MLCLGHESTRSPRQIPPLKTDNDANTYPTSRYPNSVRPPPLVNPFYT